MELYEVQFYIFVEKPQHYPFECRRPKENRLWPWKNTNNKEHKNASKFLVTLNKISLWNQETMPRLLNRLFPYTQLHPIVDSNPVQKHRF